MAGGGEPSRLRVSPSVARLIRGLHPVLKAKVRAALDLIAASPHAGKALKDELDGLRSFRVGRFRIVYRLEHDGTLAVVAVGPRRTIYEDTLRLVRKSVR
jgi:mRNA interferase RelE/StbE